MSGCIHFDDGDNQCHACMSDELTALRERVAQLEARGRTWKRLAHRVRSHWLGMLVAYRTEKQRADTAERATVEAIAAWLEVVGAPHWLKRMFGHGNWRRP